MTLVELLVVIVLITTLVSTAIPIISPGGDNRRLREASRNINAYLQGAQARAIQTGRPFGVAFRRLSSETENPQHNAVCTELEYVEVPAPYTGLDDASLARVCEYQNIRGLKQLGLHLVRYGAEDAPDRDGLPPGYDVDAVPDGFFRPGDQVEVGGRFYQILPYLVGQPLFANVLRTPETPTGAAAYSGYFTMPREAQTKGVVFRIMPVNVPATALVNGSLDPRLVPELSLTHDAVGNEITFQPGNAVQNQGLANRYACTTPAPYRVYRQPVSAGGDPLVLPNGAAIDLQASVFGDGVRVYQPSTTAYDASEDRFAVRNDAVMVLFSPEGRIDRAFLGTDAASGQPISSWVTSSLALCVGRRELIPAQPTDRADALTAVAPATNAPLKYDEPVDLIADLAGMNEEEQRAVMDNYNWLNLDSRWIVVGAQSGSVVTVENSAAFPASVDTNGDDVASVNEQLAAALDNAPRRTRVGGR